MDFPASPTIGQRYTWAGKTWEYNGEGWALVAGGATATPGGSSTQIQYNDGGILGGDAEFTYNKTTNELTIASGIIRHNSSGYARIKPVASASSTLILEPTAPTNTTSFTAYAYDGITGGSGGVTGDNHTISISATGGAPSNYLHVDKIGSGAYAIYKSIAIGWGPAVGLVSSGTAIYMQANTSTGALQQVVIGGTAIDGTGATLRVVGNANVTGGYLVNGTNINTLYASAGHTHTLNDLTDATITAPSSGQVLSYNGSQWVNSAAPGVTNLSWTASTRTIASDTGNDAVITLVTPTDPGLAPASGGGTSNFLRADGTWAAPANTGQTNIQFQDEGSNLGTAGTVDTLDFTGSNLTASRAGNKVTVAFTGAIGSGITYTYSATAPVSPNAGDEWVDSTAGILYKYIDDGDTTQWVDFSGSGAPIFTSTLPGIVPASGGGTTNFLRADGTWVAPAGTGTVTSVGLSLPAIFNVTNSPVITTGTLTGTLASQTQNLVFASPNGSSGTPTFRALAAADFPTITVTKGGTNITTYTTGDLLYASATDTLSKLPAGTNTHVLTMVAGVPAWAAPGGAAGTNLTYTAATRVIASDTGTDATLPLVTSADAGLAPATGGGTSNFLRADGTWAVPPGTGGTPSGSNTQVQFNDSGSFGGDADLTWNKTTNVLTVIGTHLLKATGASSGFTVGDRATESGRQLYFMGNDGTSPYGTVFNAWHSGGTLASKKGAAFAVFNSDQTLDANNWEQFQFSNNATYEGVIFTQPFGTGVARKISLQTNWPQNTTPTQLVLNTDGTTSFGSRVDTAATTASTAGLRLPHGTAPSSPVNGDVWTTTAGIYVRVNGSTVGPLGTGGGGTPGGSTTQLQYNNAGAFGGITNVTTDGTNLTALTVAGAKSTFAAAVAGYASINLPHGTAPSAPADGDIWTTTAGAYVRVNGSTVGPLGTGGGGTPGGSNKQIQYNNSSTFAGAAGFEWDSATTTLSLANAASRTPAVAITYGATTTIDCRTGQLFRIAMTGNITTLTLNNAADGQTINVIFVQDGTGGRTVVWPGTFTWVGQQAPLLSTTANYIDVLTATYSSTDAKWLCTLGTQDAAGPVIPGGANTQVQFNDSGVLNGSTALTINKTTGTVTMTALTGAVLNITQLAGQNGLIVARSADAESTDAQFAVGFTGQRNIVMNARLGSTNFNPTVTAGDSAIWASAATLGNGVLNLTVHSATSVGIRMTGAGAIGITGTTTNTGSLTVSSTLTAQAAASVAGMLTVSSSAAGTTGSIYLSNATNNQIYFVASGVAAPTFSTRSAGTKIVLYPGLGVSNSDFALGIESNTLWFSKSSATTDLFKWYGGTTLEMSLQNGTLTLPMSASKLRADMSTATAANRFALQTSVTNGTTVPWLLPNGTGDGTGWGFLANSALTNGQPYFATGVTSTFQFFDNLTVSGTGTSVPTQFRTNNSGSLLVVGTIQANGNWNIGTTTSDPSSKLRVEGAFAVTGAKSTLAATAAGYASLNLPHGTAPSSPTDGDVWTTTAGIYVRVNGATVGPLSTGGPVAPNYEEFVATASQTVFNTTMTTTAKTGGKAYLQVFVNGVLQQEGATKKFTVTGANQITFNAGLALNDDVAVFGYA